MNPRRASTVRNRVRAYSMRGARTLPPLTLRRQLASAGRGAVVPCDTPCDRPSPNR